jgi:hypothetical protein
LDGFWNGFDDWRDFGSAGFWELEWILFFDWDFFGLG